MQTTVFIGIGTNKGKRKVNILNALKLLSQHKKIKIVKASKMLRNPPQEGIKSGYFLNGAIKLITSLSPIEFYKCCKSIEKKMGRTIEKGGKGDLGNGGAGEWGKRKKSSRIIDLDILFYGNKIVKNKFLTIPHPLLHKRYFVLIPLLEVDKDFKHPILKKSINEIYKNYKKRYLVPSSIKN